jgi:hypothetical protein
VQFTPEVLYLISYTLVILMKIICFVLSYKIIKLGYYLITAGVKGEFKFSSSFLGFKADLASLSPGLLFVLLGVLFMMVAIYVNKTISLQTTSKTSNSAKTKAKAVYNDTTPMPGANDFNVIDTVIK